MTRTGSAVGTIGALVIATVGCGSHRAATPPPPVAAVAVGEKPGALVEESVVSAAATVVKVDQRKRVVTLKNAEGDIFDVQVGEEVKNLPQIRKGDQVVATYYDSMAISVRKPGQAEPAIGTSDIVKTAKPGEKPGGLAASQTTVTATVVALNKKKGTVTLKGPGGKVLTVAAREPRRLEDVEVGDLIEVFYTEAVAIAVDKPETK
jgi:hypothetical protein